MDNNTAEQAIRPFTIGRTNFVIISSSNGAKASTVIYSIVETAKANNLNIYDYLELLLSEIPNHMDDKNLDFLDKLLPWSDFVQNKCSKSKLKSVLNILVARNLKSGNLEIGVPALGKRLFCA